MEESSTDSAVRTTLPSPSHSSDSFSFLPSEPPDIRNWFSSYKYESFVLDTCDEAFRPKARGDDAEKIRANDGDSDEPLKIEECQSFSEVPDSLYSQPVLNEPHHPDNWLSTFVSETCGLDHYDDGGFETAPSQGKDDFFVKKGINTTKNLESGDMGAPEGPFSDEFVMSECQFREGSDGSPSQEVPDNSYSQPVFHDNHHSENWLSTCVPETCGLDPDDDKFEIPASQGKDDSSVKEGIDKPKNFENTNSKSIDLGTLEKPFLDELVTNELQFTQASEASPLQKAPYSQPISILSEPPDITNWFSSYAYQSPLLDEEINNGIVESESQHVDNSLIYQEPKPVEDMNSSHSIDKEPSTKLTPDEQLAPSVSGFVTTRKKNKTTKRPNNDENSCPGSRNVQAKCLKSNAERLVSSPRNRKVLSERTNVVEQQQQQPEFTGKWKCPQRSKPVMGPPLKQLRLERWITKL
ncbi:hypothetical protein LINPERPRIM_LOCUS36131 [Linum perenne]